MTCLLDGYDAVLLDLDGVVYLGPTAVPGAAEALAEVRSRGVFTMFVTNNAARPASVVVDQLVGLGFAASTDNVLTAAQVAASRLPSLLPAGAAVLVCGSDSLASLLSEAGLRIVTSADDRPDAVLQGYEPDLSWRRLEEATLAIQHGAAWYATNADGSRPTDRGLVPGVGGQIAAVATALGGAPVTFGKPSRPMLDEAVARAGASRPIFVGDRLDTDIEGANRAGMDSLLVFSGAHGKHDLLVAPQPLRPVCIGADVSALLAPPRRATSAGGAVRCGAECARIVDNVLTLERIPADVNGQLDALWALLQLAWAESDADAQVLNALDLLH